MGTVLRHPDESSSAAGPTRVGAAALLLLALSLALRFVGLDAGLPHMGEPDRYVTVQTRSLITHGLADRSKAGWKYPHLLATIAAATAPEGVLDPAPPGASVEEHRSAAAGIELHVRFVTAALAALCAPVTFLIAMRWLAMRWAFVAGLLAAGSVMHVWYSWQGRPHAPVGAMGAVAVLCCIRYAERPAAGRSLVMGLGCAVSAVTLHTGAAAAAPLVVALLLAKGRAGFRGTALNGALAFGIVAAAVAWFYLPESASIFAQDEPFSVDAVEPKEGAERLHFSSLLLSGHPIPLTSFDGAGVLALVDATVVSDPFLALLALAGLAVLLAGFRRWTSAAAAAGPACVLAFALPSMLVLCGYSLSYPRFFLLLTSPLALLGATGARRLADLHRWVPRALVAGLLLTATWGATLRVRPDTYQAAAATIAAASGPVASVDAGDVLALPVVAEATLLPPDRAWSGHPWDVYQLDLLARGKPLVPERALHIPSMAELGRFVAEPNPIPLLGQRLREIEPIWAMANDPEFLRADRRSRRVLKLNEAWVAALESEGYELTATIQGQWLFPGPQLRFHPRFLSLVGALRRGPTIRLYRRTATPGDASR